MATSTVSKTFLKKLSTAELEKVVQVAKNLSVNVNWLLAVMFFETAQSFNPAIKNGIGSVGLIQFTRDKAGVEYKTIGGKKYYLSDIAKMSFVTQMDLVEKYLKEAKGGKSVKSFTDLYLLVFFPAAVGKADDFVLATSNLSASLIAKQNPIFDRNKDGVIHKKEVTDYFKQLYTGWGFDFEKEINTGAKRLAPYIIPILAVFFYTCFTASILLT